MNATNWIHEPGAEFRHECTPLCDALSRQEYTVVSEPRHSGLGGWRVNVRGALGGEYIFEGQWPIGTRLSHGPGGLS